MSLILVVEDEPLIGMMLADWLIELGHEPVGPCGSVSEALTAAEKVALDAAILDVNLRGERCDRVADALAKRSVPLAFATGADAGSLPAGFAACCTLLKPYDFDSVQRVVSLLCHGTGSNSAGGLAAD